VFSHHGPHFVSLIKGQTVSYSCTVQKDIHANIFDKTFFFGLYNGKMSFRRRAGSCSGEGSRIFKRDNSYWLCYGDMVHFYFLWSH
jgi:hypothetical protein